MAVTRHFLSVSGLVLALAAFLTVIGSQDAMAGKKKNRGKPSASMDIKHIGVKSIDHFFADVRDIDGRLDRAQRARRTGRTGVNAALGLEKGTPLQDAVRELKTRSKGNLSVMMTGGVPQLTANSMLPSDLVTAVDAVNSATSGYAAALKDLAGIPKRTASLVKNSSRLPKKLKSHYVDDFSVLAVPQMVQQTITLKNNIKLMRDMPSRSRKVVKGLNKDLGMLVQTFGGDWPPLSKKNKKRGRK
jgi:ribosomal protein S13